MNLGNLVLKINQFFCLLKGPLFSYLRLVYDSKLNGKMNDYTMTIDYTFTLDSADKKRSCVLTMNTDCMAGSCNIYKMLVLVVAY